MIRRCSRDFCHFLAEKTKIVFGSERPKNQDFCISSYVIDHEQLRFEGKSHDLAAF